MWRHHVEKAVYFHQKLQVVYVEGCVGMGKVQSWDECAADAIRRDALHERREEFIAKLPEKQKSWLADFSDAAYTSEEFPNTERSRRWDEEVSE